MARITARFGDIPSTDMPDGQYDATINKIEHRGFEGGQEGYLNWEFQVAGGEHVGRKVYLTTSFKQNALWNMRDQMAVLGIPTDADLDVEIDDDTHLLIDPDFIGRAVQIDVANEEYNKRNIPKVSAILKAYDTASSASGPVSTKKKQLL